MIKYQLNLPKNDILLIRVGNILENVALIPPQFLRIFEGYSQKPSKQTLILTSKIWPSTSKTVPSFSPRILRGFEGEENFFSKFSPQKTSKIFENFREFSRISQKTWKIFENFPQCAESKSNEIVRNIDGTFAGW